MKVVVGGRVPFSQHSHCLQVLGSEGQEEAVLCETQFLLLRPWYHVLRVEWRRERDTWKQSVPVLWKTALPSTMVGYLGST